MGKILAAAFAAILGFVIVICAISFFSAWNTGNRSEQQIQAAWENNQNILAQYGQKISEMAQVPGLLRDDLVSVFTGANEARYGKTGSAAVMQWIQEQNPNLDASTYKPIQQAIEAGRNEFQAAQKSITDIKRSYRTDLGSFWTGLWLRLVGYPTVKVGYPIGTKDDYPIISTSRAEDAFKKGKEDGPLQLRPPK